MTKDEARLFLNHLVFELFCIILKFTPIVEMLQFRVVYTKMSLLLYCYDPVTTVMI